MPYECLLARVLNSVPHQCYVLHRPDFEGQTLPHLVLSQQAGRYDSHGLGTRTLNMTKTTTVGAPRHMSL